MCAFLAERPDIGEEIRVTLLEAAKAELAGGAKVGAGAAPGAAAAKAA
jgi:hypothetical protein